MSSSHNKTDLLIGGVIGLSLAGCLYYAQRRLLTDQQTTPEPTNEQNHEKTSEEKKEEEQSRSLITQQNQLGRPHRGLGDAQFGGCLYFDYNATTPIYHEVYEAMMPFLTTCFGNPSSSHIFGKPCKAALLQARKHIATLINALSMGDNGEEIVFTSCGSESDNRAIDIALKHYNDIVKPSLKESERAVLPTIITSAIEHPAILCYLRTLAQRGDIMLKVIAVNEEGFIKQTELTAALSRTTALVTVMHSNNEVGTIQPIRAIGHAIAAFNHREKVSILFHSDAAQSIGKVPIDVQGLGVDMLTIVGHKFGAPKGIAALYIKRGLKASPLLVGGGQEGGLRAGTENVPYAVALGEAARIAQVELNEYIVFMLTQKLRFLQTLEQQLGPELMKNVRCNGPIRLNGSKTLADDLKMIKVMLRPSQSKANHSSRAADVIEQLPNTISVSFKDIIGHELVANLANEVACSAGSACHSAPTAANGDDAVHYALSEVLQAMSVDRSYGLGTLRLSLGRHTSVEDIDKAVPIIVRAVKNAWGV